MPFFVTIILLAFIFTRFYLIKFKKNGFGHSLLYKKTSFSVMNFKKQLKTKLFNCSYDCTDKTVRSDFKLN